MKNQILKLRAERKTYNEIKSILGCSKGTIAYHCGDGQKQRSYLRNKKNKQNVRSKIISKLNFFRNNVHGYKRGRTTNKTTGRFSYANAFKRIYDSPICYLTGREINFEISRSYHLDHKIPISRGGKNDLKNMGLACKEANTAKSDLLIEEFIQLCVDVCKHNGYDVNKIGIGEIKHGGKKASADQPKSRKANKAAYG